MGGLVSCGGIRGTWTETPGRSLGASIVRNRTQAQLIEESTRSQNKSSLTLNKERRKLAKSGDIDLE